MEDLEASWRIARSAYGSLNFAGPVALGTSTVFAIGCFEASLWLKTNSSKNWWRFLLTYDTFRRFIVRYGAYNILPSLIWASQSPQHIVRSSKGLRRLQPTELWLHTEKSLPARRAVTLQILSSIRGAIAGTIVLSNVIAITNIWQSARTDYANRIYDGREPPLQSSSSSFPCVIRLAGVRSDVTELSMKRRRNHIWPIFENAQVVREYVERYGKTTTTNTKNVTEQQSLLPHRPVFWQVDNGKYSKLSSWERMRIPKTWLFDGTILYLEADATCGDENALALFHGSESWIHYSKEKLHSKIQRPWREWLKSSISFLWEVGESSHSTRGCALDLDLKEVGQGFRRLTELLKYNSDCNDDDVRVMRVILVDPSIIIRSGGGRHQTIRQLVQELALADIIVDARASVLHAMLRWLDQQEYNQSEQNDAVRYVVLETPSSTWFHSIRLELRQHGYEVIDREQIQDLKSIPFPVLVYERSSADTVHTIRQFIERGIVSNATQVCALLTSPDGLDEIAALNETLHDEKYVAHLSSSDIHDQALEWVRYQTLQNVPPAAIQEALDAGTAWKSCYSL